MKLAKFISILAALIINTALASELPNSLPNNFDSLGPTVKQLTTETGRQIVIFLAPGVSVWQQGARTCNLRMHSKSDWRFRYKSEESSAIQKWESCRP